MLINGLITLLNYVIEALGALCSVIFAILPNNPFTFSLDGISDLLGYLNYIVPVTEIVTIITVWGTAIGLYYIYQIALRWIKVVE